MDSPSESESTRRTRRLDRDCPASENKSMKTISNPKTKTWKNVTFQVHDF